MKYIGFLHFDLQHDDECGFCWDISDDVSSLFDNEASRSNRPIFQELLLNTMRECEATLQVTCCCVDENGKYDRENSFLMARMKCTKNDVRNDTENFQDFQHQIISELQNMIIFNDYAVHISTASENNKPPQKL